MIKGKLQHIGILTSNLDKAKYFYGEILALPELKRPDFFIPGAWFSLGDVSLHVMLYQNMEKIDCHPECNTVQPHFALSMKQKEMTELLSKLNANNVHILEKQTQSLDGILQYFFYDFDGNMIEINRESSDD